jgi:hypothetical protein
MLTCQFCNNTFTNKRVITVHQTKAKYCLKIQGKSNPSDFPCILCHKKFGLKHHLNIHMDSHDKEDTKLYLETQNLRSMIEEQKKEIGELKVELLYSRDIFFKQEKNIERLERALERFAITRDFQEEATIDLEIDSE